MRHTIEEKRKLHNGRKKKKRHQKTELKCATLIESALRDVRVKTEQQRNIASKYYRLWKKSVDANKKLRDILNTKESTKKVL